MKPNHNRTSLLGHAAACLLFGTVAQPLHASQTFEFPIASGMHDAEEKTSTGAMDVSSSDLELGLEKPGSADPLEQVVGLLFTGVNIPQDVPVIKAYIQFSQKEDKEKPATGQYYPLDVTIRGEASASPAAYGESAHNISSRPVTTAAAVWNGMPSWPVAGESGTAQRTSDLTAIIEELRSRPDYSAGAPLNFIIRGNLGANSGNRTAISFENTPSKAAKLVIVTATKAEYRILSGNDDAEQTVAGTGNGSMDITSSDLEIIRDGEDQILGLRYAGADIPKNARIISASIQFKVDETKNRDPFEVTIRGEASDSPARYEDILHNISSRPRTLASVPWTNVPAWSTVGEAGPAQRTPDLATVVQEIVDRPGYEEGSPIAFLLEGTGTRTAESFEGDQPGAPVLTVTYEGEKTAPSTGLQRLIWNDDPSTTVSVQWEQLRGESPVVHYGTQDHGQDWQGYPFQQPQTGTSGFLGMDVRFAKLSGLTPDTDYFFVIRDSATVSRRFRFRTAPAVPKAFTFINAGDSKEDDGALQARQASMRMVAKLQPLFVFWTGDFNSGEGQDATLWRGWLGDWLANTTVEDRLIPMVVGHGNHEDGDHATLSKLFDAPYQPDNLPDWEDNRNLYYSLNVGGDLLHMVMLNTQNYLGSPSINAPVLQAQTDWLAQDLSENSGSTFRIAGMHRPFRPHTDKKPEGHEHAAAWAHLLENSGTDIVFEGDSHVHKVTVPVRYSADNSAPGSVENFYRDDATGIMYIGEGNFGDIARSNDDDKPWTIGSGDSYNHFQWVSVAPASGGQPASIQVRTVKTTIRDSGNTVVDLSVPVEPVSASAPFTPPAGIELVTYPPFLGDTIQVPFTSPSGSAPAMPLGFTADPVSFTRIDLTWESPAAAHRLLLEQRHNGEENWSTVSANLLPGLDGYSVPALSAGNDYEYRLRAYNIFGYGQAAGPLAASTPADDRLRATFREGDGGYVGTRAIGINSANPDYRDTRDATGASNEIERTLMHFDNIFGTAGGQIPAGAHIVDARLRLFTEDSSVGGVVKVHKLLVPWNDSSTWNTLGGGIHPDGVKAEIEPQDTPLGGLDSGIYLTINVTRSLRDWQANPTSNYGWILTNDAVRDDVDFFNHRAADSAIRPFLQVTYIDPVDYSVTKTHLDSLGLPSGKAEDADNDGYSNFHESIFAMPTTSGSIPEGQPAISERNGRKFFNYRRARNAAVEWRYEGTSDLGTYSPFVEDRDFRVFEVKDNGDGSESVTIEVLGTLPEKYFLRIHSREISVE